MHKFITLKEAPLLERVPTRISAKIKENRRLREQKSKSKNIRRRVGQKNKKKINVARVKCYNYQQKGYNAKDCTEPKKEQPTM